MTKNILLLGSGGNVTNGIYRIIKKLNDPNDKIFVSCVDIISVYSGDIFLQSPYAKDPEFFIWLDEVIIKNKIELVLTGVEEILYQISSNENFIRRHPSTTFIVEEKRNIDIFQSKLETCQWLEKAGLEFPKYYAPSIHNEIGLEIFDGVKKILVKPIHGKSSIGITEYFSGEINLASIEDNQIAQEYVGNEDNEVTVGCFYYNNNVYQCQLKRKLIHGHTSHVELIDDSKITDYCDKIIRLLEPNYPVNIQLRLRENGDPVCFEINSRISGSAPFRHLLGFRDVEALLLLSKGQSIDSCFSSIAPIGTKGARVLREEVYLEDNILRL